MNRLNLTSTYLVFSMAFIVLLFSACNKDCEPKNTTTDCVPEDVPIYHPGLKPYGEATMLKNCNKDTFSCEAQINTLRDGRKILSIYFDSYIPNGVKEGVVLEGLGFEEELIDTFPFNEFTPLKFQQFIITEDGERIEDEYVMDTTKNNWINLITVDTINDMVVGEFETHYHIIPPHKNMINPDHFNLTKGKFSCSIRR